MYVPAAHRFDDADALRAFMRGHPFALLTSQVEGEPFATHLPVTVADHAGGLRIRGHLARANPHAAALDGATALVVFGGPNAYVSPRHYDSRSSVPTWNYIAVHAGGPVRTLAATDVPAHEALLAELIAAHEPAYQAQWDGLSERYRVGMMRGIVAFELEVTRLHGKAKLSQNKSAAERRRIAGALARSAGAADRGTAAAMRALEHGESLAWTAEQESTERTEQEDGGRDDVACPFPHD